MTFPAIKIVDLHRNNEEMDLDELTETCLGSLVRECERVLDEIKDAFRKELNCKNDTGT